MSSISTAIIFMTNLSATAAVAAALLVFAVVGEAAAAARVGVVPLPAPY